ncbi:YifB family Mg chelatase-like AAA ATPase [Kitasatospora sp. NRRL B-11411]|uniref:YifB family Mg chelatase-like AAA ATPase n=1 Tax=Kitasatospora sp. NRRL B-11411 TaxID=1463822 RepID=UPI000B109731|nr:ATP-binding protein [Kitasatospora sp. NRRL B-11411]
MAFARTCSVALVGVDGVVVEVQADLEPGLAAFSLVGLADKALLEARDRVRAAVSNSGEKWPLRKLTVGLTPASVPKSGSGYDLAVACAVLAAAERLDPASIDGMLIIGELGLDGRVRPVRGVLPAVLAAADAGYRQIVVAEQTAAEAKLVPGVSVLGVRSLRQLIAILTNAPVPDEPPDPSTGRPDSSFAGLLLPGLGVRDLTSDQAVRPDLADVAGQDEARQALEIAAAGGHHLYLKGPPGAGKTMLAERLPALLPPLTPSEALEVTAIHSVAGLLPPDRPLIDTPPYCAPHHSTTMPAIVGGGTGLPRPGAVSLAHRGVLFLDEAPEFPVRVLDALRQPLESGEVMIARAAGSMRLPARFLLCIRYAVVNMSRARVRHYVDLGMAGVLHSPGPGASAHGVLCVHGPGCAGRVAGRSWCSGRATVPDQPDGRVRHRSEQVLRHGAERESVEHAGRGRP